MSSPGSEPGSDSELRRRRDRLAEDVAQLQWNLGGLAYEMAIRDHFSVDVLMRRAATLQERDAELAEVERLLYMKESSIAGSCATCGAVRSRGAVFCWQCGMQLMERVGDREANEASAAGEGDAAALVATDVHEEINRLAARPAQAPSLTSQETVIGDGNIRDPAVEEPALEGPAVEEPAVEGPAVEESAVEESAVEESATRDPMPMIDPHADESALGRPVQTGP
jgi:hypothetical protein